MSTDFSLVVRAATFADLLHRGQTRRGGEPYINYPMRVAGTITLARFVTPEMVAAAWLHDVVEDTRVTPEEAKYYFSPMIAEYVYHSTEAPVFNATVPPNIQIGDTE